MSSQSQHEKVDLDAILETIGEFEQLEGDVRTLLLESLPHAVASPKSGPEPRHKFQQVFLDLVRGELDKGKVGAEEAVKAAVAEGVSAESESAEAAKVLEDAKSAQQAAATNATQAEQKSEAAYSAVQEAEAEHKEVEHNGSKALERFSELSKERARASAIFDGSLRMLLEGGWDDEEGKVMAVEAVTNFLSEIKGSDAVAAAAPHALGTKPEDRKAFDRVSADIVNQMLNRHLAGADEKLKEQAPRTERLQAEILGLWAIADCARDSALTAKIAVLEARERQEQASQSLQQEQGQVEKRAADVAAREVKRARLEARAEEVDAALVAIARIAAGPQHDAAVPAASAPGCAGDAAAEGGQPPGAVDALAGGESTAADTAAAPATGSRD